MRNTIVSASKKGRHSFVNQYLAAYIRYRIEKSEQTFQDALLLAEAARWNGSVNRLYYACYYIASALVLKAGLDAKTHAGVRNQLNQHYIKTGLLPMEMGKLYTDLFDSRQKGDYGDLFDFDSETVLSFIHPVRTFLDALKPLAQPDP